MATDMNKQAMALEAKKAASSLMECAPIVRAMAQANLSEAARLKIKRKMDIAYTIAKLLKMGVICEFELAVTVYDHITYCNYQCNKYIQ